MEVADKEGTSAAFSAGDLLECHGGHFSQQGPLAKGTRRKEQKERKGAGDTHPSDCQC